MVISEELKRFGKAARRRPAWLHLLPSSTPFESPCHSSCSLLWGGFVSGLVSHTPSFSVHSAPPRDVRSRNGLAFPPLGITAGWAGWPGRRERRRRWLQREPRLRCAVPPRARELGVRLGPAGIPHRWCPEGPTPPSPPRPHLPGAELHFSLGLAFCLVSAVRGALGEPVCENAAVSFSEQVAILELIIFMRAVGVLRHSGPGAPAGEQDKATR